jgi:hypothetical protein
MKNLESQTALISEKKNTVGKVYFLTEKFVTKSSLLSGVRKPEWSRHCCPGAVWR